MTLAIPLGILVFFAKVDTISTDFAHPVDFLVPGVLVARGDGGGDGVARHRDRFRTPLRRAEAARLDAVVARRPARREDRDRARARGRCRSCSSSSSASRSAGTCRPGSSPAVGLLLLGTVAFAGIGMLMAGTLRAEANLAAANGLFLVLLFLGGMAYPLAKLPTALQDFAKALPAAALSETVRVGARRARAFPAGELVVLVVWAVAAPAARRPLLPLGGVARLSATGARESSSSGEQRATAAAGRACSSGRTGGRARRPCASMKTVSGIACTS